MVSLERVQKVYDQQGKELVDHLHKQAMRTWYPNIRIDPAVRPEDVVGDLSTETEGAQHLMQALDQRDKQHRTKPFPENKSVFERQQK